MTVTSTKNVVSSHPCKPETRAKIRAALRGRSTGPRSEETKAKIRATKLGHSRPDVAGARNHWWSPTGRCVTSRGRIHVRIRSNVWRAESRVIMEQALGRRLTSSELVHHINENPLDNRIENLLLVTRPEHNQIHARVRRGEQS